MSTIDRIARRVALTHEITHAADTGQRSHMFTTTPRDRIVQLAAEALAELEARAERDRP